jgi:predicted nucleic acid-binding protein
VDTHLEGHEDSEFITTTLNIKEIAVGRALQDERSLPEIRSTFEWVRIVPSDIEASFAAAELEAALQRDSSINQVTIHTASGVN